MIQIVIALQYAIRYFELDAAPTESRFIGLGNNAVLDSR